MGKLARAYPCGSADKEFGYIVYDTVLVHEKGLTVITVKKVSTYGDQFLSIKSPAFPLL